MKIKNLFKTIISVAILTMALSVSYYFVLFLPKQNKLEIEKQEFNKKIGTISLNKKYSEFKEIEVIEIYDNTYAININSGNYSICLWRYNAGNANIPFLKTTKAKTIDEKHKIEIQGIFWDEGVYCFDDWGNKYIGKNKDNLGMFFY